MTWNESAPVVEEVCGEIQRIEKRVLGKLGGRLREFFLDEAGEQLVLRGKANSYHVKQLAQHEVMGLTSRSIRSNLIEVCR